MLFDLSGMDILGLTLTAIFGFAVGKLRRTQSAECKTAERDMQRAKAIIQEFEGIAAQLQQAFSSINNRLSNSKTALTLLHRESET